MKRRLMSFVLAAVMVVTMLPGAVLTAQASTHTYQGREMAIFPLRDDFHISQIWNGSYSHSNQIAVDCLPLLSSGMGLNYNAKIYAPFTGAVVETYSSWGCVVFESSNEVLYADGTVDKMTVVFGYDNNSETYTKNKIIKQGEALCAPGTAGGVAWHTHIFVIRGTWKDWCNGGYKAAGQTYVNSSLQRRMNMCIRLPSTSRAMPRQASSSTKTPVCCAYIPTAATAETR